MTTAAIAAIAFALITGGVIAFQVALALGAPWGAYAMGGAFSGRYPPSMRVAAVAQAVVLGLLAFVVLSLGGVVDAPWGDTPAWIAWALVALLAVAVALNVLTPSAGERRIWAPVSIVLLACTVVVALAAG